MASPVHPVDWAGGLRPGSRGENGRAPFFFRCARFSRRPQALQPPPPRPPLTLSLPPSLPLFPPHSDAKALAEKAARKAAEAGKAAS